MSSKSIREYDGKLILNHHLKTCQVFNASGACCQIRFDDQISKESIQNIATMSATDRNVSNKSHHLLPPNEKNENIEAKFIEAERRHPWLLTQKLVVKPDQLIKRRGKTGLIALDITWTQVKDWIREHAMKPISVEGVQGSLKVFLIEPFVSHDQSSELYICIRSIREGDEILFSFKGGIDVNVEETSKKIFIPIDASSIPFTDSLSQIVSSSSQTHALTTFISDLYTLYVDLQFTYLEINPLVIQDNKAYCLDLAAKLDQTAEFECGAKWTAHKGISIRFEFPSPFGRELTNEEAYIADLDSKTGASLKLTILNPKGRIWTMVAGGGASVIYSDTIAGLGFAHEMANYGEYSGAPSETQTYEYAKTIIDLMTRSNTLHKDGKVLLIGGGIANFTNVASTFKGIIRAIKEYHSLIIDHKITIYVRRAGPNYQEGLKLMKETGDGLNIPIFVYGPETHMTAIVSMALIGEVDTQIQTGKGFMLSYDQQMQLQQRLSSRSLISLQTTSYSSISLTSNQQSTPDLKTMNIQEKKSNPEMNIDINLLFHTETYAFVYGMQPKAVQSMLDFDYLCSRSKPSVVGMIYPFGGDHVQKFYWGSTELLLPVYRSSSDALKTHPQVDVIVNFSSCRSVFESVCELIKVDQRHQLKAIAIIAEGVPERRTRQLIAISSKHLHAPSGNPLILVGPATVGGIRAGCFKIGNTGGMIDNLAGSKLYKAGAVSYVSKSGGMSNELNNIIARATCETGVCEGIAIGGDRYPGTTFLNHFMRYERDPQCKMLVLLGEIGGTEEYKVAEAIKKGLITKPVIAWCIGTCADLIQTEVQFGHAGACANNESETAKAKNEILRESGALVPETFEDLPALIQKTFNRLVEQGIIDLSSLSFKEPPRVPMDYSWAQELGLVRKPAHFVTTICDDRGQELLYAGMSISKVFQEDIGIGGVVSLLWFRRRLPDYATKFIEMVLMLTADHGPAVSGAHNTIVTARAGKDLISSLTSGLLTIGERFGGALDGAAEQFSTAYDQGLSPYDFVESMRKQHKHIMGIGHKIKSRINPDHRVTILKEYAKKNFPMTPILDYSLAVEAITTTKKDNLILNVDGATAVLFVDLLRQCGAFSSEEAEEYIKVGALNGLFVLGRSIGFIGHYIDQKRLKQGLYRHPWDDISYIMGPEANFSLFESKKRGNVDVE